MKYIIIVITISFLLGSCGSNPKTPQVELKINREPLNETEFSELNEIPRFFDSIVRKRTGIEVLDSAYHTYMESVRYPGSYMNLYNQLALDKEVVDSFLLSNWNSVLFPKVFFKSYGYKSPEMKDTSSLEYIPNYLGGYMEILEKAITIDSSFLEYKEGLETFGSIPPHIVAGFQNLHEHLEFENEIIRTIVAIHYVSIISWTSFDSAPRNITIQ